MYSTLIGLLVGILLGGGVASLYWWNRSDRVSDSAGPDDCPDRSLKDMLSLVALNPVLDVGALMSEYGIDRKHVEFFEKYQQLRKQVGCLYVDRLIVIFSRGREEYVRKLMVSYPSLGSQDIVLLLMEDMKLENKVMARILGVNPDTLKKRKTRLKSKMGDGLA